MVEKKHIKLGIAALAVVALVIGLSVGITQSQKNTVNGSEANLSTGLASYYVCDTTPGATKAAKATGGTGATGATKAAKATGATKAAKATTTAATATGTGSTAPNSIPPPEFAGDNDDYYYYGRRDRKLIVPGSEEYHAHLEANGAKRRALRDNSDNDRELKTTEDLSDEIRAWNINNVIIPDEEEHIRRLLTDSPLASPTSAPTKAGKTAGAKATGATKAAKAVVTNAAGQIIAKSAKSCPTVAGVADICPAGTVAIAGSAGKSGKSGGGAGKSGKSGAIITTGATATGTGSTSTGVTTTGTGATATTQFPICPAGALGTGKSGKSGGGAGKSGKSGAILTTGATATGTGSTSTGSTATGSTSTGTTTAAKATKAAKAGALIPGVNCQACIAPSPTICVPVATTTSTVAASTSTGATASTGATGKPPVTSTSSTPVVTSTGTTSFQCAVGCADNQYIDHPTDPNRCMRLGPSSTATQCNATPVYGSATATALEAKTECCTAEASNGQQSQCVGFSTAAESGCPEPIGVVPTPFPTFALGQNASPAPTQGSTPTVSTEVTGPPTTANRDD